MVGITEACTRSKDCLAERLKEQHKQPINKHCSCDDSQKDKPKPQENVDLFVDDVQWKNAQSIVLLHISRGTVSMEGAFGHSREDCHHWVDPVFLIHLGVLDHIDAIGGEGTTEESVN